jgi:hypothetical protein
MSYKTVNKVGEVNQKETPTQENAVPASETGAGGGGKNKK